MIKILIIITLLAFITLQTCGNNCDNCTSNICYSCLNNFTLINKTCINCNNCTINCQQCQLNPVS